LGSLRKKISTKFRNRYKIILRQDDNLEEKVSVVLTPLNVLILTSTGLLLFGAVIYMLLAYTPLNHFFPTKSAKYSGMEQYKMTQKIDSLETSLGQLRLQSDILGKVLAGEDVSINMADLDDPDEKIEVSPAAPIVSVTSIRPAEPTANDYNFFVPLKGVISDTFNQDRKHLAVDIAAKSKEVIKSVQKGTVIFAAWTPNGGHTLIIQHPGNFLSVYKHNAVLLKNEGTFVNAGDAVALVGNTGELSSGPHLHFELWKRGVAVNPQNYINF
jgi:murein DD-endopeptidase MepM/ murein hydrolase activator NlpD